MSKQAGNILNDGLRTRKPSMMEMSLVEMIKKHPINVITLVMYGQRSQVSKMYIKNTICLMKMEIGKLHGMRGGRSRSRM